ncbi:MULTISPECIES: pre-peptidase C-terminal domain-containing protein [unclassified Oleiphilus]|uniref:pre-peptidase C-terminal domain-containing protein n=1 Tax=Oleiphilus sp. HI0117 TaxID=1822261 RepID=UPI0021016783|nr:MULTISPECIES: pre-peptidase C-terminal domain-containing protein [unclassified Oleiphilus]
MGGEDKVDVYQYSLTKGTIYSIKSVNLQGSGSTTAGGLQFEVIDEDGSPVVSNYDLHQDIASSGEFSVTETGTYYLRILSQLGTIYQNDYFKYEVAIWEPRETWDNPHSTENNMEPNETPRLAYAVDVSQPIVSQLEMGSRDNVDSYAVALYPGNQYLLTVTATDGPNRSSASRLQIKVTDEDGTVSFVPESPLSVGVEQQFIIESLTQTNAVIELFYNYTNGHLEDYHAYEFEVTLQ